MALTETRSEQANQALSDMVRRLCRDYLEDGRHLNHQHEFVLPSLRELLEVLGAIKDLLFPDHRIHRQIRKGQTEYIVGGIVETVHERLRRQIYLAMAHDDPGQRPCPVTLEMADRTALAFLGRLPGMRAMLELDVQAALEGDPAAKSTDEIIFCYPGFQAVATYRIAHELFKLHVPLIPRIWTEHAHQQTGTDIHPGAEIGPSFFIDHATGVVIGETCVIGARVKLYQGVTLGALSFPKDAEGNLLRGTKRHPTIEDDVVIYANATVLGGETTIGRGAVIGGSCWITHSIPAGTKVMLQEPQMKFRGPRKERQVPAEPDWCI